MRDGVVLYQRRTVDIECQNLRTKRSRETYGSCAIREEGECRGVGHFNVQVWALQQSLVIEQLPLPVEGQQLDASFSGNQREQVAILHVQPQVLAVLEIEGPGVDEWMEDPTPFLTGDFLIEFGERDHLVPVLGIASEFVVYDRSRRDVTDLSDYFRY